MPFTESNYENAVLQLFTQTLGYSYAYGPDIERDYHSPLYEDELLPALQIINPPMPQAALDDAGTLAAEADGVSLLRLLYQGDEYGMLRLLAGYEKDREGFLRLLGSAKEQAAKQLTSQFLPSSQ